jgi:predicted nucleic acid-binding protein
VSGYSFDSNILIYALMGNPMAHAEIARVDRPWISRITWIELLSKGDDETLRKIEIFLGGFSVDEVDARTASHAAALRRERPRLKLADAVILASAQVNHRILITNNTRAFPATMPGIRVPHTL